MPTVLAVYNWRSDRERQQRRPGRSLSVRALFQLQTEPGYHPQWSEVNLAATYRAGGDSGRCRPSLMLHAEAAKNADVGDQDHPGPAMAPHPIGGDPCARAGARRAAQAVGGAR